MSETTFYIIENAVTVIEILLFAFCLVWFIGKTYGNQRKIVSASIFLIYAGFYLLRQTVWDIPGWTIFFVAFVMLMIFRLRFFAFLIITWYCVINICFLLANSVYTILADRVLAGVMTRNAIHQRVMLVYLVGMLLRIVLLYVMSFLLILRINHHMKNIQRKEVVYLLLTPTAGVLFGNIIKKTLLVIKDESYFSLYEQFPMFLWIIPAVAILIYLAILFSLSAYSDMMDLQEQKKKNFVEEQQLQALRYRMEEVEQFYDTARKMKHEIRNHVTTMKGLIVRGAYDEADGYIEQIESGLEPFDFDIRTGNAVTDVIINDAQKKADKLNIDFRVGFNFEDTMGIEAFDMGIVLRNLLENAIEACEKQHSEDRWIQVTGKKKRKFFLLEVKNSLEGTIKFNKKTGLPHSTKPGAGSIHGIGLENVSTVADKYLGSIRFTAADSQFLAIVMLQGNEKNGGYL